MANSSKQKTYEIEVVEEVRSQLKKMADEKPPAHTKLTKTALVESLRDEIQMLYARGYSADQVVNKLKASGIELSVGLLMMHTRKRRRKRRSTREAGSSKSSTRDGAGIKTSATTKQTTNDATRRPINLATKSPTNDATRARGERDVRGSAKAADINSASNARLNGAMEAKSKDDQKSTSEAVPSRISGFIPIPDTPDI